MNGFIKTGSFRVVALILVYGGLVLLFMRATDQFLFGWDFTEYWTASRLNWEGRSPYDPDEVWSVQRELGLGYEEPLMMYNPPWTLGVVLPLGLIPLTAARGLWLILSSVIVLGCADVIWRYYGGPAAQRRWAWLLAVGFAPALAALGKGQITPVVLLGI